MPDLDGPFAPNHEDVAAKVIDGELIIIRLSDGTYYSIDNVGSHAWLLLATHDVPSLARILAGWYGVPLARVETDVRKLVAELLAERLIVPQAPDDLATVEPTPPAEPLTYESPSLNVYRDMGNLLALDPPTPGIDELLLRNTRSS